MVVRCYDIIKCIYLYSLSKLGAKVGIFDADIYGPSLPTMINKNVLLDPSSDEGDGMLHPVEHEGVKCMSYGFVSKAR